MYNLKYTGNKLSFQPNKRYRYKIMVCLLLAVIAFVLPLIWLLPNEVSMCIKCIGGICVFYAVYDFLFKMNMTYVFDCSDRQVCLKIPGLFSRRLMAFEEVYLLTESENCVLHYVLANKKDKYGKNYPISAAFSDTRKGRMEQEQFEDEIYTAITKLVKDGTAISSYKGNI